MTINPGGTTLHERIATSHEEVRGDQVGVDPLTFGLEVDPFVHEEFGPIDAGGMPVGEHGVLRVPPQAHLAALRGEAFGSFYTTNYRNSGLYCC
jgi:hypothetical protein